MAKWANDALMDAGLAYVTACDLMVVCSQQPATYLEATSTYALADVAPTFTGPANGTVSGRRITVDAKTGVAVDSAGTGTHVALVRTTDSTLRYVTTSPSQALAGGGTVDIGAWDIEIRDPS